MPILIDLLSVVSSVVLTNMRVITFHHFQFTNVISAGCCPMSYLEFSLPPEPTFSDKSLHDCYYLVAKGHFVFALKDVVIVTKKKWNSEFVSTLNHCGSITVVPIKCMAHLKAASWSFIILQYHATHNLCIGVNLLKST